MNENKDRPPMLTVEVEPEPTGPNDIVAYSSTLSATIHALAAWDAGSTVGYDFVTDNVQRLVNVQLALAQYIVEVDTTQ